MKTKAEWIEQWQNEMVGLLMKSFAEAQAAHPTFSHETNAKMGREMIQQMKRCKDLMSRMYDDLAPAFPPKPPKGKE